MTDTKHTKRHYFTQVQILKSFKPNWKINLLDITEDRCDAHCWKEKMRARTRRFELRLEDVELWTCSKHPAIFKLRICNIPSAKGNVNVLTIRYFFYLKIDTKVISIAEVAALVNDWNIAFSATKTVLLDVTDKGYGFCSEIRCHVADTSEILENYNRYKWIIYQAPEKIAARIEYYLTHKDNWDWTKKSVKHDDIENYKNRFEIRPFEGWGVEE